MEEMLHVSFPQCSCDLVGRRSGQPGGCASSPGWGTSHWFAGSGLATQPCLNLASLLFLAEHTGALCYRIKLI